MSFYDNKKFYEDIEIYFNYMKIPDKFEPMIPPEMFFTFEDISNSFELFIRNWFKRASVLAPVFNLYFSNIYLSEIYLETRFLNATQAIESYHRRKGTTIKYECSLEEHKARIISIISSAPVEHREWLDAKLKHSNEFILGRRLKEILSLNEEISDIYISVTNSKKRILYTKLLQLETI